MSGSAPRADSTRIGVVASRRTRRMTVDPSRSGRPRSSRIRSGRRGVPASEAVGDVARLDDPVAVAARLAATDPRVASSSSTSSSRAPRARAWSVDRRQRGVSRPTRRRRSTESGRAGRPPAQDDPQPAKRSASSLGRCRPSPRQPPDDRQAHAETARAVLRRGSGRGRSLLEEAAAHPAWDPGPAVVDREPDATATAARRDLQPRRRRSRDGRRSRRGSRACRRGEGRRHERAAVVRDPDRDRAIAQQRP